MKKQLIIFIIVLLISCIFISDVAHAQGIVPCGRKTNVINHDKDGNVIDGPDETKKCTLCHFFILIDNIVDFLIFNITPPLFLLMMIIGGGMFILASGNPATITRAKKIVSTTLIGVAIIYGAYTIVGLFLQSIGLSEWTTKVYSRWWTDGLFEVSCDVMLDSGQMGSPSRSSSNPPSGPPASPPATTPPPTGGNSQFTPYDGTTAPKDYDPSIMMSNWDQTGDNPSDLNDDKVVNDQDFDILKQSI